MGKVARVNVKKKFRANDVIPVYEAYYKLIVSESLFISSASSVYPT